MFWEMIKMEIRTFVKFLKKKAKSKHDEESSLLSEMIKLQCKLQTAYTKFSKIASVKTCGTIIRSAMNMARKTVGISTIYKKKPKNGI